jgi:hypothetical protein
MASLDVKSGLLVNTSIDWFHISTREKTLVTSFTEDEGTNSIKDVYEIKDSRDKHV